MTYTTHWTWHEMEGCGCLVYGVAQGLKLECLCIKGGLDMIVLCYATLCIHIYIYKIIYRVLNFKIQGF